MSKTKGGGSTRNGRDSNAQRLGVKTFDGTTVPRRLDPRAPARHPVPPGPQRRAAAGTTRSSPCADGIVKFGSRKGRKLVDVLSRLTTRPA